MRPDVTLSIAALLIYGLIAFTVIAAIKRLGDIRNLPVWIKPALVLTAIVPVLVASTLLNPGTPADASRLARLHDKDTVLVPPGHALLVRGVLSDLELLDDKKRGEAGKTNYRVDVTGEGWTYKAAGEIRRKTERGTSTDEGGASLKDQGRARAAALGEDLEQRFDLPGAGTAQLEIGLWQGAAVDAVLVEVVRAPPPRAWLWALTGVAIAIGLVAEVRYRAVQVSGDMAFLASFAVFMLEQITPASGFQEAGVAAFGAALLGWLGVGGVAWMLLKLGEKRAASAGT